MRAKRVRGARETPHGPKAPFEIHEAVRRLREAVRDLADAAMFELRDRGWGSLYHQLVACILSIRTRDEVMLPTALALFDAAPGPAELAALDEREIDRLIGAVTFHERKAAQIRAIARRTVDDHDGTLPCDAELLLSFAGVGPKCANLALGVACGAARIGVDVHVWRVTNRWGIIAARTPEQAIPQLEAVLPREYWIEINRLLVPFGKHVCTGTRPKCSTCPLLEMCEQVGVSDQR
ncbi:MAG TPA: endonuclease III [Gemmatimonadaceae bacterium]|nr:endonuclease III [Gemmatimonadaceae bacterium]